MVLVVYRRWTWGRDEVKFGEEFGRRCEMYYENAGGREEVEEDREEEVDGEGFVPLNRFVKRTKGLPGFPHTYVLSVSCTWQ